MDNNQKPQIINPTPQITESPAKKSIIGLLTATFFVSFIFFGLLAKEILDKGYDGGGLGYLIIFVFIFPTFLVISIICVTQIVKIKRSGEKIGLNTVGKATLLAISIVAAILAIPFATRIWESFF